MFRGSEIDANRRAKAQSDYGVTVHVDVQEALVEGYDGFVVAVPAELHVSDLALPLRAGSGTD